MKQLLFFLFWFFCFSIPCIAQLPDSIELEANSIEYSNKKTLLVARDNVQLTYQNLAVSTNAFIFDSIKSEVSFPEPLDIAGSKKTLSAKTLTYNFQVYSGNATCLDMRSPKLSISANEVAIKSDKIIMKDSFISMCSHNDPPFYLTAETVEMYPLIGVLVAKKNKLYNKYIPVTIPIPYYIYGSKSHALLGKSSFFPELGSNTTEGQYAVYSLPYIVNPKWSGNAHLGYSEKLHWLYGVSSIYSQSSRLTHGASYRYYANPNIHSIYYVSRFLLLKPSLSSTDSNFLDSLLSSFSATNLPKASASLIVQKNKLIHNYWVDYLPKIHLDFRDIPGFSLRHSFNVFVSNTLERDNPSDDIFPDTESEHLSLYYEGAKLLPLTPRLGFLAKTSNYSDHYSRYDSWNRSFLIGEFQTRYFLNPRISYQHKLLNEGSSPFNFEKQYAIENNEIGFRIYETFYKITLTYHSNYDLHEEQFRQKDISLQWALNCWNAGFTWQTVEKAFKFNVSLQ